MIRICRAEDGEIFQVNGTVRDIERAGSLESFLHQETRIDQDAILAYLSDGRRLQNDNIRDFASAQDQSIFVFNKYYLDLDLDGVLRELRVEPPLQPPIEEDDIATPPLRPSQVAASFLETSHIHHEHVKHISLTLHYQHEAVRIESNSLDLHVLAITDIFEGIAASARKELEKQSALLAGLEADLEIIARVKIHVEFMSPGVRRAIESGEKPRTLGDYVSIIKMKQVAETCQRTHEDLRSRFIETEEWVTRLTAGATSVRESVTDTSLLEVSEGSARRAKELFDKITNVTRILESPNSNAEGLVLELRQLDMTLRDELVRIVDAKNAYTEQCMRAVRRISALNTDLVQLPPALSNLKANLRGKNSFSHIQRLHNMLYAYGATVIEIVRRKEFTRFFYQRAQSILEVMAKLSASERKRRQVYRGDVHGLLPFDTRGMDDPVPSIDFSPSGSLDAPYSLEREDVDGLFHVLDDLEQRAHSTNDPVALATIKESRTALEKLVTKMDTLESGFDRIAERSLLSASRISSSRRRSIEADEQAYQELIELLHETQQSKHDQEVSFQRERDEFQTDISQLKSRLLDGDASATKEQERANRLERDLHYARSQVESESAARKTMEARHSELFSEIEDQRNALATALGEATEQAKIAERLREELTQVRAEFEELKTLEARNAAKVATLVEDQAVTLRNLEEARARGEDLALQIQSARAESEDVNQALKEASKEKDRLLRAQASEHDRIIRDHIAEADGDRAVLEHQFEELKAMCESAERQLKDSQAQNEISNSDAVGLREELKRVEHELREARLVERVLRDDLKTGRVSQSDYEQRLDADGRLIAQILDVAIAFRNSHVKALNSARAMTSQSVFKASTISDPAFSSAMRHNVIGQPDEPSPIDPSDPAAALEILRSFDHDDFAEALAKTGSTIRKWQKQCKEYRERAKGKISFRNFTKGDLALFLPTRNSVSKPWAAFNVSFPHYFLQATGHLAEQLKTREWIVARMTSITEHVVNHNDPSSNPFGLGDGVKYYMLQVEDWTQPSQQNKRRVVSKGDKAGKNPVLVPPPLDLNSGPPQAEVEDSFRTASPPTTHLADDDFRATRPPSSHLFPIRSRSNSSPNAGPSSLSRLLAQAPAENALETTPPSRSASPTPNATPPPPPSPTKTGSANHGHAPSVSSPLRPGSRASRMSSSSRFSVGRIPPLCSASPVNSAVVKTAPTTALSDHQLLSASPSTDDNAITRVDFSSPEDSQREEMSSPSVSRRRTSSYHIPRTSPLITSSTSTNHEGSSSVATRTLATLANSWGVSFGRKRTDVEQLVSEDLSSSSTADSNHVKADASASELLKRF